MAIFNWEGLKELMRRGVSCYLGWSGLLTSLHPVRPFYMLPNTYYHVLERFPLPRRRRVGFHLHAACCPRVVEQTYVIIREKLTIKMADLPLYMTEAIM